MLLDGQQSAAAAVTVVKERIVQVKQNELQHKTFLASEKGTKPDGISRTARRKHRTGGNDDHGTDHTASQDEQAAAPGQRAAADDLGKKLSKTGENTGGCSQKLQDKKHNHSQQAQPAETQEYRQGI